MSTIGLLGMACKWSARQDSGQTRQRDASEAFLRGLWCKWLVGPADFQIYVVPTMVEAGLPLKGYHLVKIHVDKYLRVSMSSSAPVVQRPALQAAFARLQQIFHTEHVPLQEFMTKLATTNAKDLVWYQQMVVQLAKALEDLRGNIYSECIMCRLEMHWVLA